VLTREKNDRLAFSHSSQRGLQKFESRGDVDFAYAFENMGVLESIITPFLWLGAVFSFDPSKIRSIEELDLPPTSKILPNGAQG